MRLITGQNRAAAYLGLRAYVAVLQVCCRRRLPFYGRDGYHFKATGLGGDLDIHTDTVCTFMDTEPSLCLAHSEFNTGSVQV